MNLDDPKFTAYALGELPEEEREQWARELAAEPAAEAAVAETRQFAAALREAMQEARGEELTAGQRQAVLEELASRDRMVVVRPRWSAPVRLAMAAGLAVAAISAAVIYGPTRKEAKLAMAAPVPVGIRPEAEAKPVPAATPLSQLLAVQEMPVAPLELKPGATETTVISAAPLAAAKVELLAPSPATPSLSSTSEVQSSGLMAGAFKSDAPRNILVNREYAESPYNKQGARGDSSLATPGYGNELEPDEGMSSAAFDSLPEQAFLAAKATPLSTFSIDVDTASYSIVRRFLRERRLPPAGAVRIEELINYFPYDYPQPHEGEPFSAKIEAADCPWAPEHRLVRIGLKGRDIAADRVPSNLVFLLDVSGSMSPEDRLPLLKKSLRLLVEQLRDDDRVAIVVYAGNSGLVLGSTPGSQRRRILDVLDDLRPGGSTNGASGIQLAYQIATENFLEHGVNRVILATDGDFNVGVTNQSDLVDLIEKKAKSGVFLSVLGVGLDNLKDSTMEKLADKGNGNYAYLDSLDEGRKVLVEQMHGTLVTIAKDVKIQVEWNPDRVASYRLIGYENRALRKEDFNDDRKDAGEIGAGHTVTALYEVVPAGGSELSPAVDALKYQAAPPVAARIGSPEMLTLKLRWKAPEGEVSQLREVPFTDAGTRLGESSRDFRWAAGVAGFGMLLRDSANRGQLSWDTVRQLTREEANESAVRQEFRELVGRAQELKMGRN